MARRAAKTKSVVNPELEDDADFTTPDETPAPSSSARREAARRRHVSLKEAATLLNRDRNTLVKYLDQGCPFVEKADRDLGKAWVLDLADVVKWLEDRAARMAAEKLGMNGDGNISEEEAKRRRAVAQAVIAEIEASEVLRTVVPISVVIDKIAKDYNEIRGRLMAVPDAIAGRVNASVAVKVREVADESIRLAIASLKANGEYAPKGA